MDANLTFLIAGLLFPITLITMEIGRRFGQKRLAIDPEGARAGVGARLERRADPTLDQSDTEK